MSGGENSSYRQILRSSSIMGGAHGLEYLVSLIRVKIVAVLLGPSGVGLISLYTSAMGVLGTVSGLGITSSGVREVAQAYGQHDQASTATAALILRRACWATGLLGWVMAVALAPVISNLVFESAEHTLAIAVLGATLFLGALKGGQTALLQGVRRIGDIARMNVISMLINTLVIIALYAWLGEQGIVPVLVATAGVALVVSWWFARRVEVATVNLSFTETVAGTRRLAGLGLAFVWSGLLTTGLDVATRTLITREYGIDAAGLYQAAWAISGLFAGFVLSAMGTDFYPRLTGVIEDHEAAARVVNEQTEIGILLALPGLLGTLAFAPWLMQLFFSNAFLPAAEMLPWFVLGIFGRVVSWPLGYIQLAKGASRWFAATETAFIAFQMILVWWTVPTFGVVGAAYSFVATYFVYTLAMLAVGRKLIDFSWSDGVRKILAISSFMVFVGLGVQFAISGFANIAFGGFVTIVGAILSLRRLGMLLGSNHRLIRAVSKIPGSRCIFNSVR